MSEKIRAIVARENDSRSRGAVEEISIDDLPENNVLVRVHFSTVNYKDALAVTGRGKICRFFPMVCGIDLAGEVEESNSPDWKPGDKVIVNGFGMSERHWGGYAEKQRVKSEWLVRLPDAFTLEQTMAIGTAGYTAMLCVHALEDHGIKPEHGEIVVSGATGGVGSVATMLLGKLGFTVVGVSGKADAEEYLRSLGASRRHRPLGA